MTIQRNDLTPPLVLVFAAADPTGGETEKGKPRKQTFHFNSHDLTPKERQEIHAEMLKRLAATMRAKREGD